MMRERLRKISYLHRPLAVFLPVCLLFSGFPAHSSAAEEAAGPPAALQANDFLLKNAAIPKELGSVEESFSGSSGKTVIYIQDAHDSLEAQESIAGLIHHLVDRHGVKTVYEEGYEGPVPTDRYFEAVGDPEVRKKVSRFFLDRLRLGGAEYAHINREKDFTLIGADNVRLLLENIDAYRKAAEDKIEIEKDLRSLSAEIEGLALQYFPKELKEWMKLKTRFDAHQIGFLDYLKRMLSLAGITADGEALRVRYPNLNLLLALERKADSGTLEKAEALDSKTLFEEVSAFENDIARGLLAEERDRKIFEYWKALGLTKRLKDMEITAEEYAAAEETLENLKTEEIARFIVRHRKKARVFYRTWEAGIQSAIRFYEIAQARDEAVEASMEAFLKDSEQSAAVLVFGGFHKESIRRILRRRQLSYLILSPRISAVSGKHQAYYRQLMSNGYRPFEMPALIAGAARYAPIFVDALADEALLQRSIERLAQWMEQGPAPLSRAPAPGTPLLYRSELRAENEPLKEFMKNFLKQVHAKNLAAKPELSSVEVEGRMMIYVKPFDFRRTVPGDSPEILGTSHCHDCAPILYRTRPDAGPVQRNLIHYYIDRTHDDSLSPHKELLVQEDNESWMLAAIPAEADIAVIVYDEGEKVYEQVVPHVLALRREARLILVPTARYRIKSAISSREGIVIHVGDADPEKLDLSALQKDPVVALSWEELNALAGKERVTSLSLEELARRGARLRLIMRAQANLDYLAHHKPEGALPGFSEEDAANFNPVIVALGSPSVQTFVNTAAEWKRVRKIYDDAGRPLQVPVVASQGLGRGTRHLVENTEKYYEGRDPGAAEEFRRLQAKEGEGLTEAKVIRFILTQEGVPEEAVVLEEISTHTLENITESGKVIEGIADGFPDPSKPLKILPSTDGFHYQRVLLNALDKFTPLGWRIAADPLYVPDLAALPEEELLRYLEFLLGYPEGLGGEHRLRDSEVERMIRYGLPFVTGEWTAEKIKEVRMLFGEYLSLRGETRSELRAAPERRETPGVPDVDVRTFFPARSAASGVEDALAGVFRMRAAIEQSREIPASLFFSYDEIADPESPLRRGLLALSYLTKGGRLTLVVYGADKSDLGLRALRELGVKDTEGDFELAYRLYGDSLNLHNVNVSARVERLQELLPFSSGLGIKGVLIEEESDIWAAYIRAIVDPEQPVAGMDDSEGFYRITAAEQWRNFQASLVIMQSA